MNSKSEICSINHWYYPRISVAFLNLIFEMHCLISLKYSEDNIISIGTKMKYQWIAQREIQMVGNILFFKHNYQ